MADLPRKPRLRASCGSNSPRSRLGWPSRLPAVALIAPLLAAPQCQPDAADPPPATSHGHTPPKKGSPESKTMPVGAAPVESPSCGEVGYRRGVSGTVVGSEWVDPDGITCLEIKTRDGRHILIRVSRKIFGRCIERDLYPECAEGGS